MNAFTTIRQASSSALAAGSGFATYINAPGLRCAVAATVDIILLLQVASRNFVIL
jgi:hypothetical protein